ncbi:hypothetical protein LTY36_01075 [Limosilactobacillus agrestis]|uniref:Uracil-DNA glycosylase-like domain-containing protein n=1 Tax=Limosilactobacillus agrestis TaxID=2759748 RepID=A0ABS8R6L1_9LACO|nr:hypothetical protein [Limosilactobacillus agrestis]MCD7129815.1 hypothetical protein [Limosilactobacillus agrestis]
MSKIEKIIKQVEEKAKNHTLSYIFSKKHSYFVEESYDDQYAFVKVIINSNMTNDLKNKEQVDDQGKNSYVIIGFNPNRDNNKTSEEIYNERLKYTKRTGKPLNYYIDGTKTKAGKPKKIVGPTWTKGVSYALKASKNNVDFVYFLDICPKSSHNTQDIIQNDNGSIDYQKSINFIDNYLSEKLPEAKILLATGRLPKCILNKLADIVKKKDRAKNIIIQLNNDNSPKHMSMWKTTCATDSLPNIQDILKKVFQIN